MEEGAMTLVDVLREDAEAAYGATECLFRRVKPEALAWKPATGQNWMTVGQLLMHCTIACGASLKAFITGDFGLPEGMRFEDLPPEEVLPPASKLPSVETVEQALQLLAADREVARQQLAGLDESRLFADRYPAPWGGRPLTLYQHLSGMVGHLEQHKAQLFFYLKLQGQDVSTVDLYGV